MIAPEEEKKILLAERTLTHTQVEGGGGEAGWVNGVIFTTKLPTGENHLGTQITAQLRGKFHRQKKKQKKKNNHTKNNHTKTKKIKEKYQLQVGVSCRFSKLIILPLQRDGTTKKKKTGLKKYIVTFPHVPFFYLEKKKKKNLQNSFSLLFSSFP